MSQPEAFVMTSNDIFILSSCLNIEFFCRNLVSSLSNHFLSRHCFSVSIRAVFLQCRDIQNDVMTRSFFKAFFSIAASCLLSQHSSLGPSNTSCRNLDSLSQPSCAIFIVFFHDILQTCCDVYRLLSCRPFSNILTHVVT